MMRPPAAQDRASTRPCARCCERARRASSRPLPRSACPFAPAARSSATSASCRAESRESRTPRPRTTASTTRTARSVAFTTSACVAGARRPQLGVDRLARRLPLGQEHRARPRRHADAGVRLGQRPVEELLVRRRSGVFSSARKALALGGARGRVAVEAPRQRVDQRVAQLAQRVEAARLGLPDVGRDDRDRLARAPLRAAERVVVLRLDGDLDRRVALAEERIAQLEDLPARVRPRLAVEARQHAALLARAAAQHEVHLAQAVVVGRLVLDRDVLDLVDQPDLPRRALEAHDRRVVGDGGQRQRLRLRDHDVAEARDDAERAALRERPARDHGARAVLDERHLRGAVAQRSSCGPRAAARRARRSTSRTGARAPSSRSRGSRSGAGTRGAARSARRGRARSSRRARPRARDSSTSAPSSTDHGRVATSARTQTPTTADAARHARRRGARRSRGSGPTAAPRARGPRGAARGRARRRRRGPLRRARRTPARAARVRRARRRPAAQAPRRSRSGYARAAPRDHLPARWRRPTLARAAPPAPRRARARSLARDQQREHPDERDEREPRSVGARAGGPRPTAGRARAEGSVTKTARRKDLS